MNDFLNFIKKCPTAYQAVEELKKMFISSGYVELKEQEKWNIKLGGKYFFSRNMSSIMAFSLPEKELRGFHIGAAHLDSPTFKVKPNGILEKGAYVKLNTEVYGSPIYSSWMDRPLGLAGRIMLEDKNGIVTKLVNITRPVAVIPHLPIHYNRNTNTGTELNPQVDMLPILGESTENNHLNDFLANELKIDKNSIISSDLYLTVLDRGCLVGKNNEFIMAPQIDNLECSYALTQAMIKETNIDSVNVLALFDNEEIGSATFQGANSTLLENTLKRIVGALGKTEEEFYCLLANSFVVSADNAQGFHPNYPQKYDEGNACYLNRGIVIKNAARGSYSTDGFSSAVFQKICQLANAKYQLNTNRSDILGGSTLGAISIRHVSVPSVDIGLAQLAMHSAYETAGSRDLEDLTSAMQFFYKNSFTFTEDCKIIYK